MFRPLGGVPVDTRAALLESINAYWNPPPRRAPRTGVPFAVLVYWTPSMTSVVALLPSWQFRHSSGCSVLSRLAAVAVWARWHPAHESAVSPAVPLLVVITW